MGQYKYSPLKENMIRTVQLLPGSTDQPIRIAIDTVELSPSPTSPEVLMTAKDLEPSLPPGWWVYETVEDDIYFYTETADGESWEASWTHPDPSIKASLYQRRHSPAPETTQSPPYEALSYTWQSNDPDEDATVQEAAKRTAPCSTLRLGGNLACALRHLRQHDTARTLWIDAICINQSDLQEREEQVAKMARIYKTASRVVVWLGKGSEDSDLALRKLDYLGKQVVLTKDQWVFCPPDAEEPFWCTGTCHIPYSDEVWTAINRLLARPWFTRIWIIQEIQLARHGAVVQCGWEEIQWSRFRNAMSCLWNKKNLPEMLSRARVAFIEFLANTSHTETTVRHVLHLTKGRQCSNPHDYVYGVLGLLPLALQEVLRPNYTQTVGKTYTDLAVSYLKQDGDLALLRDCQLEGRCQSYKLPSWVPDFSNTTNWPRPFEWQNAAANSKAIFHITGAGFLLQVTGVECAAVSRTEKLDPDADDRHIEHLFREFRGSEDCDRNGSGQSNNLPTDVLCRTIAGGYLRGRFPDEDLPTLEVWKSKVSNPGYLRKLVKGNPAAPGFQFHEQWVSNLIQGRVLFRTDRGSIGLGPPGIMEGDIIVVLLGCDSPLVLRPESDGRYLLVGECYMDDLGDGASLLGPLLPRWHVQVSTVSQDKSGTYSFLDTKTGEVRDRDPRIPSSPGPSLDKLESLGAFRDTGGCIERRHGDSEGAISSARQHKTCEERRSLLRDFILS